MVTLPKFTKDKFIDAWLKYYDITVRDYFISDDHAFMYFIWNDRIVVMNIQQDGTDEMMGDHHKQLDNSCFVNALRHVFEHDPSLEMSDMLIEFGEFMFGPQLPDGMYITKARFREE